MITYLKSETERLEKEIEIEDNADYLDWRKMDLLNERLSTLIKTSWIFARKIFNIPNDKELKDKMCEIISYGEAKAKEHKIDLEDGE